MVRHYHPKREVCADHEFLGSLVEVRIFLSGCARKRQDLYSTGETGAVWKQQAVAKKCDT